MGNGQEEKGLRVKLERNIRKLVLFILAIAAVESIVFLSRIHWTRSTRSTFSLDVSGSVNLTESENDVEAMVEQALKLLMNSNVDLKSSTLPSKEKSSVFESEVVSHKEPPSPINSSSSDPVEQNAQCLQHLLDANVVEYYYYPENDDSNLNFTVRGCVSKSRLLDRKDKPSLVSSRRPTFERSFEKLDSNDSLLRNLCRSEIFDFLPNMMARDYDRMRNLIKFFKHVAALSGMEYYLNYGSLLGHVRFNKRPIPWDDDLDFSVDYSVLKKFRRIFKRERRIYFGNRTEKGAFYPDLYFGKIWVKVFDASQKKVGKYNWTFPFIDLFFYRLSNEDFYDLPLEELESFPLVDAVNSVSAYNLSLDITMPFKKEMFLGIELPIPANAVKVLKRLHYSTTKCKPLWWYHRYERGRTYPPSSTIKCSRLEGFYDFGGDL